VLTPCVKHSASQPGHETSGIQLNHLQVCGLVALADFPAILARDETMREIFWKSSWQMSGAELQPCRSLKETGFGPSVVSNQMQGTP
jgi:hypothetical protein